MQAQIRQEAVEQAHLVLRHRVGLLVPSTACLMIDAPAVLIVSRLVVGSIGTRLNPRGPYDMATSEAARRGCRRRRPFAAAAARPAARGAERHARRLLLPAAGAICACAAPPAPASAPPPVAVGGGSALGLTGICCNTSRISSFASTSCFAFISFFRSPARFFCAAPKKTDRRLAFSSSSLRFISRSLRILLRHIHASRQRSTTTLPCLRLWNSSIFLTMIGTISSRFASLSSSKKAALPARMKILYMPSW